MGVTMRDGANTSHDDANVEDAPNYWMLPFEEDVRLLMERYGESADSARRMMAIAQELSAGDAHPAGIKRRSRRTKVARGR
jgi:hypothetical protein